MFKYEEWLKKTTVKYSDAWKLNDTAHRQKHFDDVYHHGVWLNDKLNLGFKKELIFAAAYFHDLFAWSRHNHHEMSYHYILTTDCYIVTELLGEIGSSDREVVAMACKEHRASFKGVHSYLFTDFFASADRGVASSPTTRVVEVVRRAYHYSKSTMEDSTEQEILENVLQHMHDKFGTKGYMSYPMVYTKAYEGVIKETQEAFDSLTLQTIKKLLKQSEGERC